MPECEASQLSDKELLREEIFFYEDPDDHEILGEPNGNHQWYQEVVAEIKKRKIRS
jgi:hypothetical protein